MLTRGVSDKMTLQFLIFQVSDYQSGARRYSATDTAATSLAEQVYSPACISGLYLRLVSFINKGNADYALAVLTACNTHRTVVRTLTVLLRILIYLIFVCYCTNLLFYSVNREQNIVCAVP